MSSVVDNLLNQVGLKYSSRLGRFWEEATNDKDLTLNHYWENMSKNVDDDEDKEWFDIAGLRSRGSQI